MTINYTEKGYGLWEALQAAGLKLHNRDRVFYSNPDNFADTSNDAVVQAFVDSYDPRPYARKVKIQKIKSDGVARAQLIFPAIADFDDLDLVSQIMQSVAPAARVLTARITTLSQLWTAGANAVAAVNAATTLEAIEAVTPVWP